MKISVIVVTYNEEKNIKNCLDSLINLEYPIEDYEIIVIDGNSEDNTKSIVLSYNNVKFFSNVDKFTASNRNYGIKNAKYDYVAFTDADCIVPRDWLKILSAGFYKNFSSNLVAVGGANIPPQNTDNFIKSIAIAQSIFVGNRGSAQGKRFIKVSKVESLSTTNILYDKKKLIEVGGFSEDMKNLGEDWEVNYKLRKKGYKLLYLPDSYVYHKFRSSPKRFFSNMVRYGIARTRIIKKYPETFNPVFLAPPLFLIGIFLLPMLYIVSKQSIFMLPLLYFPLMLCISIFLSFKNKNISLIIPILTIYYYQHLGYGIGMIYGIFSDKIEGY